ILSSHQYSYITDEGGNIGTIYDPYGLYNNTLQNFNYYNSEIAKNNASDMEFWCDEYFSGDPDAKYASNKGIQMTQFAAGLTAGMNNGINRFSTWQMFDVLWDSNSAHGDAINGDGQFGGGVHVCGTCPSLVFADGKRCTRSNCSCQKYDSRYHSNGCDDPYVPRVTYYGINLIGKYMNNDNADVFKTEVINVSGNEEGGVYVSAIKNDEGKTVVLVVNTMSTTSSVNLEFDKDYTIFTRYTYDPNEVVPTKEATSLPGDKTINMEFPNFFYDIIPAQSFAIYVET
ncbi:MAG: hypothetical protein U0L55_03585, partial [Acutalibacteraceae bacterium]|nr:hypothetical protein [Acutalibacteraceae bacterium]